MVNDVEAAVAFYTSHLGFTILSKTPPLPTLPAAIYGCC